MTTQQLNRDVKRLQKDIENALKGGEFHYHQYIEGEAATEFKRLYNADSSFKSMSKSSILLMVRMNLRHRFIPLHSFGLNIEI